MGWWYANLLAEAAEMTSLKWLDLELCQPNKPHPVWEASMHALGESHKAKVRAKLLCGIYKTQEVAAKHNLKINPTCVLCGVESEGTVHFLMRCKALAETRLRWKPNIDRILSECQLEMLAEQDW